MKPRLHSSIFSVCVYIWDATIQFLRHRMTQQLSHLLSSWSQDQDGSCITKNFVGIDQTVYSTSDNLQEDAKYALGAWGSILVLFS